MGLYLLGMLRCRVWAWVWEAEGVSGPDYRRPKNWDSRHWTDNLHGNWNPDGLCHGQCMFRGGKAHQLHWILFLYVCQRIYKIAYGYRSPRCTHYTLFELMNGRSFKLCSYSSQYQALESLLCFSLCALGSMFYFIDQNLIYSSINAGEKTWDMTSPFILYSLHCDAGKAEPINSKERAEKRRDLAHSY